jgi:predicted nucleic acid-binding protein
LAGPEGSEQTLAVSGITVAELYAGATLVTLNRHHFPMLAEVLVPYAQRLNWR